MMSSARKIVCPICNNFARGTFSRVLCHIGEVHGFDPDFRIVCGLGPQSCPATYTNFRSFQSHVYKKHRGELYELADESDSGNSAYGTGSLCVGQADIDDQDISMINRSTSGDEAELAEGQNRDGDEQLTVTNAAALFILKTMEIHKTSQVAMDGILDGVKTLFGTAFRKIKADVVKDLLDFKCTDNQIRTISSRFSFNNPFEGLETRCKQDNYIKKHLPFLEPVERVLHRYYEKTATGQSIEKTECCYDIPLIESLQQMLNCTAVVEQVSTEHKSTDGKLRDYCDGSEYETHDLFKTHPFALRIHLYYDELEVCNPLGSKATTHKLGVFYYSLGNLRPSMRSTLHSIQLVAVVKSTILTKHGINVILEPFMADIQKLEQDSGVPFMINGKLKNKRGTLVIVSADNPAACLMGGFKQLHSAFRKCRFCMAVDEDMKTQFSESLFELRTPLKHSEHCVEAEDPLLAKHNMITNGVECNSVLHNSHYFHVLKGLLPDIMHDILEGVLQLTLMVLLRELIVNQKKFRVSTVNSRILSFCYGSVNASNKPSILNEAWFTPSNESMMKQSASQAWCLGRYLPLLIGDLVPTNDKHWENFLMLMDIIDYAFAPVTTVKITSYMGVLIEDFLTDFCSLYPHRPPTPKMHYLIHVPSWMRRCGPLCHTWCMRYEAKHSYLKQTAYVIKNFKNIPKSLAYHHQRLMCYRMADSNSYLSSKEIHGTVTLEIAESLEYIDQLKIEYPEIAVDSTIHRVNHTTILGTKYAIGFIIACYMDQDMPVFGMIQSILVFQGHPSIFILKPYIATSFNVHFHAYEVSPIHNQLLMYQQSQFLDYHPLAISRSFETSSLLFVRVKYHL